jgi:hypothetical protein
MARSVTFFPAVGRDSRRRTEKIRKLVTTLGY